MNTYTFFIIFISHFTEMLLRHVIYLSAILSSLSSLRLQCDLIVSRSVVNWFHITSCLTYFSSCLYEFRWMDLTNKLSLKLQHCIYHWVGNMHNDPINWKITFIERKRTPLRPFGKTSGDRKSLSWFHHPSFCLIVDT